MVDTGYFPKGKGCELKEETISKPHPDEAVIFEEFLSACLWMPPHPVLADIY
jgi:hypothetical protein